MASLPSLPLLSSLSQEGLPSLPSLSDIGQSVSDAASSAKDAAASGASQVLFGGISLSRIVVIIVGLLLFAAGIFSFKEARQVLVQAGTTAAKAAA